MVQPCIPSTDNAIATVCGNEKRYDVLPFARPLLSPTICRSYRSAPHIEATSPSTPPSPPSPPPPSQSPPPPSPSAPAPSRVQLRRAGTSETPLGPSFGSELDCAAAVRNRYPLANGASYSNGGGTSCYAEFGMNGVNPGSSWRTCLFDGWPSPSPSPPPPSPSPPPLSSPPSPDRHHRRQLATTTPQRGGPHTSVSLAIFLCCAFTFLMGRGKTLWSPR